MHVSSERFLQACDQQGVVLSPSIVGKLASPRELRPRWTPLQFMVEQRHIWLMQGHFFGREISKPIDTAAMPSDGVMRLAGALLNLGVGVPDSRESAFTNLNPVDRIVGTCEGIEACWSRTVAAMDQGRPPYVQVFVNESGRPVLMRKGRGETTGILVAPVRGLADEDELVYPEGTIVKLETNRDHELIRRYPGRASKLYLPGHSLVSPADEIISLCYARLSPLMYDEQVLLDECPPYYREAVSIEQPLSRLIKLANEIVDQAGMVSPL